MVANLGDCASRLRGPEIPRSRQATASVATRSDFMTDGPPSLASITRVVTSSVFDRPSDDRADDADEHGCDDGHEHAVDGEAGHDLGGEPQAEAGDEEV